MKETFTSSPEIPQDPDPNEWLTMERLSYLHNVLSPISPLLDKYGHLKSVLISWLDSEIYNDVINNFSDLSFKSSELCADVSLRSTDQEFSLILSQSKLLWAEQRWGHRLETLYLRNKNKLDKVSCFLLTVASKNLAYELYIRLKEKEASFNELSFYYGIGRERFNGGLTSPQPLISFPKIVQEKLLSMAPGDFMRPFQYGKGFAILQLSESLPARFDLESKSNLLMWELEHWQSAMISVLKNHLPSINE